MNRPTAVIALIVACGLFLASCSGDSPPTAPTDPSVAAKGDPVGPNPYLVKLRQAFDKTQWISVPIVIDRTVTTDVSVVPNGYPSSRPLVLHVNGTAEATSDGLPALWPCQIQVPAPPIAGGALDIPGDCLIYRFKNFPPPNVGTVTLGMPVAPWNDTSLYNGFFESYRLVDDANGWPQREGLTIVEADNWPPSDPDLDIVYVTINPTAQLEGGDKSGDGVIDPKDPQGILP